jgi:AAHS family 4-hydroxybenzoate transporter-like MFS transporter
VSESPFKIDIVGLLAERRIGRFHFEIIGLCALAMFVDGFDTQILNYAAPAIARSMLVNPAALGKVFSYGGIGSLIGILGAAPLADRIGRKPVMIGSLVFFAIFTLAMAWAQTVTELAIIHLVCGIGLGSLMPSALALGAEFMPRKYRITLTVIIWFGFSLGSGIAGPVAIYVLHDQRWPYIFMFGALVPVAVLPILWTALPESPLLIVRQGEAANPRIRATLIRISRRYDRLRTNDFFSSEHHEPGFPVWDLFREGRAPVTAFVWIMFFTSLMTIFFVNAFLSSVLGNARLSESGAATVAVLTQLGGIVGGLAIAFTADRVNRYMTLAAAFFLGAVAIVLMGAAGTGYLVGVTTILAGLFALGTQNAANAVVAASYPTAMRATAIGWALGIGRNGQIVAPILAADLVSLRLSTAHVLYIIALPGLVAAAAALFIAILGRRLRAQPDPATA